MAAFTAAAAVAAEEQLYGVAVAGVVVDAADEARNFHGVDVDPADTTMEMNGQRRRGQI